MKIFISVIGSLILSVLIQELLQLPSPLFAGLMIAFFIAIMLLLNLIFKKKSKEPEKHWNIHMIFPEDQKNADKFSKFYKEELDQDEFDGTKTDEIELEYKIADHTVLSKLDDKWTEIGTVNDRDLEHINSPAYVRLYFSKNTGFFFRCSTLIN